MRQIIETVADLGPDFLGYAALLADGTIVLILSPVVVASAALRAATLATLGI